VKRLSQSVSMSRNTPLSPSPDPSFVSHPPDTSPRLNQVPIQDHKTGRLLRRYERHPSRNRFFLRGHLLTGGDSPWAFAICFSIVLGITGFWFGSTCVWWWHNESPAVAAVGAYLALIVISSMLATAFSDPGILPRNLDPDPPSSTDGDNPVPFPRDLRVRNDSVRVKYCPTCKTYRPPRASHCKMCDNCVDGCDHHCQWVNNCVGRRNYTSFFVLLFTATLTLVFVICTSALHLYLLTVKDHINYRHALRRAPGSAVAFCMAICIIWPVAALFTYHVRLLVLNITTIEQIRNQAHKSLMPGSAPPNPFTHGSWTRNLFAVLWRPRGLSWLNASAVATEDKRKINPGMFDNVWDGGSGLQNPGQQT
jgi:palmitoyltransferase ZDHHC9/14/18